MAVPPSLETQDYEHRSPAVLFTAYVIVDGGSAIWSKPKDPDKYRHSNTRKRVQVIKLQS